MRDIIISAIQKRTLVRLWYEPGERLIEPHAFGIGSNRQLLLRAFQIEGASASHEHFNWKLFRIDRVKKLEAVDREFIGPRPDYKLNDRAMPQGILCQLGK